MECPEFESALDQRLDERLDPRSSELQAHAAGCGACQTQLDNAVLVLQAITAWHHDLPAARPEHASRIVDQVRRELAESRQTAQPTVVVHHSPDRVEARHSWHAGAVLAGSVAALWFVFAGSMLQDPNTLKRTNRDVAAVNARAPVTKSKVDLGTVLASAGGAYSQVANDSFAAAQDFALLWPASKSPLKAGSPAATPGTTGTDWTPGWSRELTPLGDSVEGALDFLRRAVPHVEKSAS